MWQLILAHAIVGFVGLLFLQAGLAKWQQREEFGAVVANYNILPEQISMTLGRWLPGCEVILGMGLLSVSATAAGPILVWMAVGLLLLFASAMAINLVRGRKQINCGCGVGGMNRDLSWGKVTENLCLSGLLVLLAPLTSHATSGSLLLGLATGITGLLLYQSLLLLIASHRMLQIPHDSLSTDKIK